MQDIYIGLISGTSADGIDAIVLAFEDDKTTALAANTFEYPDTVREEILHLSQPAADHAAQRIDRLGHLDNQIGQLFAAAATAICQHADIDIAQVSGIGSHGQTLRHRPQGLNRFSLQVGDPNIIALNTGRPVVADFRRMDMAAKGQGAPLVPLFHQWLMPSDKDNQVILNLGGIANITWLPKNRGAVQGFDTGPASALMDYWIQHHQEQKFDENGQWAQSGKVHEELLKHMLADPYFKMGAPKSTGREYFDAKWLQQKLKGADPVSAVDVQASLCELTAITIVEGISRLPGSCDNLLVCGGGFHNEYLMARIKHHLPKQTKIGGLSHQGIDSDFIEAATFAWLARQRIKGERLDYTSVTGADRPLLLGGIYQA
ncbi:anhydro-N-acetylmuramic acid kinase [Pleionea litopenaei]|uniref:Anhydro-N-acetylmuramic acid kinase n=1 Tax=Pleionea litopenaei TaxID=3070815 RepID=A0AA51RWZ8_9GAMM|nr:anhydro-N-acetylmuramic acid kinase [Pleionea sp. HL-JVS1]WMS89127.1 anhydro-N-acetylmuramic acid kinase [Pleionea sp. HL-JVS1]